MTILVFRKTFQSTTRLALPLIGTLLAEMGMQITDSIMMGRLGPLALAAGALVLAVFLLIFYIVFGLKSAMGIELAHSLGAKNSRGTFENLFAGIHLDFIMWVPICILLYFLPKLLLMIGQSPDIVHLGRDYLWALIPGILPLFLACSAEQYLSAIEQAHWLVVVSVSAITLNLGLNYVLMYGKFGLPALGITGIGLSTSIVDWLMFASLALICLHQTPALKTTWRMLLQFHRAALARILRLGTSISLANGVEMGLLSITTLGMGYFGAHALSGHQIAMQYTDFSVMIAAGIGQAASIMVSKAIGAKNPAQIKEAINAALLLAVGFGVVMAALIALFSTAWINLFFGHAPHIAARHMAHQFLRVAIAIVMLDAIQFCTQQILRAMKDTTALLIMGVGTYWVVGLGAAFGLAFKTPLGPLGFWIGLMAGMGTAAVLLVCRLIYKLRQHPVSAQG
jgi:MATE family multidrug resistance protein